ncbi:LysR family transcriptional regulator [Cryptosporangium phraense]|uniref:LysR family transcriptional regulator n=1 Tax=Cryptosporangium phraense TaxID=2593070 RepID=A0A545AGG5_9ACTN|nr:LysR family transcriptional regulator [Cryptosporangium phraense]TQS40418.1 LysR family transcriptional regulator [Cryptosporangium phraense]
MIDDLAFFRVVARSETLTAASRALGRSLPVVSKRLAALEKRLGAKLVQRGTRRLTLTAEGEVYAERVERILDQVRELDELVGGELPGALVVHATLGLGRAHIAPLLAEFAATRPGLRVRLDTSALPLRRDFDVAIRVGTPPDSTLRLRRLAENQRVPCAAPSYLAARGTPETVEDLAGHDCIVLRENESDFALWRFGDASTQKRVRVGGTLASNDGDVVTAWAREGRGIILRSRWHVQPFLDRGELVRVLPHVPTPAADIYALTESDRLVSRRAGDFVDFLAASLPPRLAV